MTQDDDAADSPGARIKALRERLGLTQTQLANALGDECSQSRVSQWENGVLPSTKWMQRLSDFFAVPAEQIWKGKGISSLGAAVEVRNEELKKVLATPEWRDLPAEKRSALALLLNDVDVEEWEVRSVMATLLKGAKPAKKRRQT